MGRRNGDMYLDAKDPFHVIKAGPSALIMSGISKVGWFIVISSLIGIVLAWLFTLPGAALLSAAAYAGVRLLGKL